MRILHTSDWHLGRSLYGKKRYHEFAAFLDWLADTIAAEKIDALLVAGDIFDNSTPSNRSQELYYRFLCKVANSNCRHIVIIAGNHDSPTFLNAPRELLRSLNVHVVGAISERAEDEVIVLKADPNVPEAIVCAVPYLRDRDIRSVDPGEKIADKNSKLIEGLHKHYTEVCAIAELKQEKYRERYPLLDVPMIAMGHLFTAGGKTIDGDGVRELYIGSLAHIGVNLFPPTIDYFALGHLHVPQTVGNAEHIRYSGSPIPMGYGEANQDKKVVVVEFRGKTTTIREVSVPCFQPLVRIAGSLEEILQVIEQLKSTNSNAWLEIEYTRSNIIVNLREQLAESLTDTAMDIQRIKNKRITDRIITSIHGNETLDDLDVYDVFERCLDSFEVPPEDRPDMTLAYQEIIQDLFEEDKNA